MHRVIFFCRLLHWFSIRRWRKHPWRLLAVLFGIALGAAVFTSVRLAVNASLEAFTRSMDLISSRADWVVVSPVGRTPDRLVAALNRHPAIQTASPLITTYVRVSNSDREPLLLIGLDPILDAPLRSWQVRADPERAARQWLDLIRIPGTLVVSSPLAARYHLEPGREVTLEHVRQRKQFTVLGVLAPQGLALVEGGHVAVGDISTVQEFIGSQGRVDRIDLLLGPGATEQDVARLRRSLPPEVVLQAPSETRETGQAMIHAYQLNLSVLSFVSLFVGMFLVYSMISMNAAARRNELAILRSLGASSHRVFLMLMAEGGIMGVLGWLLAIPIATVLVRYLVQGVSSTVNNLFVRVRVGGLQLDTWEVVLSFGVTLFISLLAAYRPAREATRVSPREAMVMQGTPVERTKIVGRWNLLALLCIGFTWPVAQLPALPGFPVAGYGAVLLLVAGFSLLAPPILRGMGSFLPPLLRRAGGQPGYLAARYVRDAGERTAISVGALVTAVALFVSLVIMVHSFRHTVSMWVNQTLTADLFIRPAMAGFNQDRDTLPRELVAKLQELGADVQLMPYRRIQLVQGGKSYQLEAIDLETMMAFSDFIFLEGTEEQVKPPLLAGEGVIVSEVFSTQTGLGRGDRYREDLGAVALDLPILGVFRDYRTRGGVVIMDLNRFQELTGKRNWSGVWFFFTDRDRDLRGASSRLRSWILTEGGAEHPLEMASGAELRGEILKIFDETFAITTVLLLIALLVAGLGITTTLTVLVLERIRELNTLVAVGAGSGQVRSMIFWEAVLMVMAGEIIGLVCGFFMSRLLIYVINPQSFGWTFLYRVDWPALLVSLPLILATALLAALPAARLVLRTSPAMVLKES